MFRNAVFSTLLVSVLIALSNCASCNNPKISNVKSFSAPDATILTHLAHLAEFKLECSNGVKPAIFAEFPCGKLLSVARTSDSGEYQVSWTEDVKKSSSGDLVLRLFDEEGYSNIRKAQRDGEQASAVKSLTDIVISAKKAYTGPWVNSEIVAALVVGFVAYFALSTKSKVQA